MRGFSSGSRVLLTPNIETGREAAEPEHHRKAVQMDIPRKIVLTCAVTLGVFALGSAGVAAVAHTLTVEDRAGSLQNIAPVTTGTTTPSPSASPLDDKSNDPTGTTTVAPADPINVDDTGEVRHSGTDDGATHDTASGTRHERAWRDGAWHDGAWRDGTWHDSGSQDVTGSSTDGSGDSGSGTSGSGSSTSGSGGTDDSGSSDGSGSGSGDGSGDTGGHH